jgi:hypothetical protein
MGLAMTGHLCETLHMEPTEIALVLNANKADSAIVADFAMILFPDNDIARSQFIWESSHNLRDEAERLIRRLNKGRI